MLAFIEPGLMPCSYVIIPFQYASLHCHSEAEQNFRDYENILPNFLDLRIIIILF